MLTLVARPSGRSSSRHQHGAGSASSTSTASGGSSEASSPIQLVTTSSASNASGTRSSTTNAAASHSPRTDRRCPPPKRDAVVRRTRWRRFVRRCGADGGLDLALDADLGHHAIEGDVDPLHAGRIAAAIRVELLGEAPARGTEVRHAGAAVEAELDEGIVLHAPSLPSGTPRAKARTVHDARNKP